MLPPKNMTLYYDRASIEQKQSLQKTFDKFNISSNRAMLGETLLRLKIHLQNVEFCLLPTDPQAKALYKVYKYYDSLVNEEAD